MRAVLPLLLSVGLVPGLSLVVQPTQLPAFKAERWVNSAPLTGELLRGKVVLVDVWEYTCINWIRTLPYIRAWNRDYASVGLVVVGVHSPEFEFGKQPENIDRAIRDHGLAYPIAIDNEFAIWRSLGNDACRRNTFRPAGKLVKRWVGEGYYNEIEAGIRRSLTATQPGVRLPPVSAEATLFSRIGQPSYAGITNETYLGAERSQPGTVTLDGDWRTARQYVELRKGTGRIVLPFTAGEVNLVIQPGPSGTAAVRVLLDGKPVGDVRGADVGADGVARVDGPRMIRLVAGAARRRHELTLVTSDPGVRAFAFTFGL